MRLLRFEHEGRCAHGILEDGVIYELRSPLFPGDCDLGDPATFVRNGRSLPLAEARLLAPVNPSKIICVGLNYTDHALELGLTPPNEPLIFLKPPSTICGTGDPILCPGLSKRVEYEAELAIVMGKRCHDITAPEAAEYILGYTCANDVTARDLQMKDGQWARAKGFDTFNPLGPWIETDVNPASLSINLWVDGELKQSGTTANMHFSVDEVVAHISEVMTLLPGDVILTGTPPGVGAIVPGNTVRIEIESIGTLENPVEVRR